MILKRLPLIFACAGLTAGIVAAAAAMQSVEAHQVGFVGLILAGWLLTGLLFGFSVRNSLLFSALFFLKPYPQSFISVLFILPLSLLLEFQQEKRRSLLLPHPAALIILFAVAVYGFMRARSFGDSYLYFLSTAIVPGIFMLLAANSRISRADFTAWLKFIVYVGVVLAVIGIVMALLNPAERYGSLWITAMNINGFYLLAFFFAIALGVDSRGSGSRHLWYAFAFLILMGMLYTYTRIVLVGVAVGFFLLMLRMKRMRYVGMGTLLLLPLLIPSSMISRIQLGFTFDYSIIIRLVAWYFSIQQIMLHPWFGIGISVWKDWYAGAAPMDILYAEHSHNIFLKIWLEIGVFGFLAYFYLIAAVLRRYYLRLVKRSEDNFHRVVLIGLAALLVACLTDIFIQQYHVSLVFWSTLGFAYALSKNEPQIEEQ
ncbi:MAG: O-antigen ligase family protein [Candidatus Syntrophosphaera sp.]|nr:O-antigen ligase family protein [Candidatus Syntrophosphaera sp.]